MPNDSQTSPSQLALPFGSEVVNEAAHTASLARTSAFLTGILEGGAGLYLLTGTSGIGKTTAIEHAVAQADERTIAIVHSLRRINVDNLSDLLGHTLGVKVQDNQPPAARALRYFLKLGTIRSKGRKLVLILDDVEEVHSG